MPNPLPSNVAQVLADRLGVPVANAEEAAIMQAEERRDAMAAYNDSLAPAAAVEEPAEQDTTMPEEGTI